jgi:hypothetical protein
VISLIVSLRRCKIVKSNERDVGYDDIHLNESRKRKVSNNGIQSSKRKSGGILKLLGDLALKKKGSAIALECILKASIGWTRGEAGFVEACDVFFSVAMDEFDRLYVSSACAVSEMCVNNGLGDKILLFMIKALEYIKSGDLDIAPQIMESIIKTVKHAVKNELFDKIGLWNSIVQRLVMGGNQEARGVFVRYVPVIASILGIEGEDMYLRY